MNIVRPHERRPDFDEKDATELAMVVAKINERIRSTRQEESVDITAEYEPLSPAQRVRLNEFLRGAGWVNHKVPFKDKPTWHLRAVESAVVTFTAPKGPAK